MSVIGTIFHGIGNLLTGHSFGHEDTPAQVQTPVAPQTPAPQQQAGSKNNQTQSMQPSFLAAAALPNQAAGAQSNVGGKSLLGE